MFSLTIVVDHGTLPLGRLTRVEEIAISKFKATCLAVLERVRKTRRPVLVTRFGEPVAQIMPPEPGPAKGWLGAMDGRGEICGDLVAPAAGEEEWEALRG